jgi:hypothetical protein
LKEKEEKIENQHISLCLNGFWQRIPKPICAIARGEARRSGDFTGLVPRRAARCGGGQLLSDGGK